MLTGTAESRQNDRLENIRQRDAEGLARLEKLRTQRDEDQGVPPNADHAELLAREEADRQVRLSIWRNLLASPQVQAMNEFEAVAYISSKWGKPFLHAPVPASNALTASMPSVLE